MAPVRDSTDSTDPDIIKYIIPNSPRYERAGRFPPILPRNTLNSVLNFMRDSSEPVPNEDDLAFVFSMHGKAKYSFSYC
jgi:hypothetical protein